MQVNVYYFIFFFFSSRRRHTRFKCDWSSDVCSSDLPLGRLCDQGGGGRRQGGGDRRRFGWPRIGRKRPRRRRRRRARFVAVAVAPGGHLCKTLLLRPCGFFDALIAL